MALSDPQSVTIDGVAISLPRTSAQANASQYTSADTLTSLVVSSAYAKRTRRTIRLNSSKTAADPFTSGLNLAYSMSAYLVVDHPIFGYTIAEEADVVDGLVAYLAASSGAVVLKLLGGEN